jgi:mRNA-degrading endonuclease RelE of RelBE toxin-antitoxin system
MEQIQKQWKKIPAKDQAKIREIFKKLKNRDFTDLNRKKLKGYEYIYRVRAGNYRIIYFDNGEEILLKYIKRRNERTYKEI